MWEYIIIFIVIIGLTCGLGACTKKQFIHPIKGKDNGRYYIK